MTRQSVATKTVKALKTSHADHPVRMRVAWVMLAVGLAFWTAELFGFVVHPPRCGPTVDPALACRTAVQDVAATVVLHGPIVVALGFFGWELPGWVKSLIPGKQAGE